MKQFRIATWNTARATPSSTRAERLQAHMAAIDADIWVITEAHCDFPPTSEYDLVAKSSRDGAEDPRESWVTVWSRIGGTQVGTADNDRTAAAVITGVGTKRLVIYGTVLPWTGSTWRDHPSANGAAFAASLAVQAADWRKFAANSHLCVAGDLNQDLLPSGRYYGSAKNRTALRNALAEAGLKCPTADPNDLVHAHTQGEAAGIDHICITKGLTPREGTTLVWPAPSERSASLTDHFGVSIGISAT